MTPLGLVIIAMLAHQGAHIVALVPDVEAPDVVQMIELLRESTLSENIFAETCDMGDLESVSLFARRWNEGTRPSAVPGAPSAAGVAAPGAKTQSRHLFPHEVPQAHRLDTILFLPSDDATYKLGTPLTGSVNTYAENEHAERTYARDVLARFHLVNSLLPSLLILPANRDIRIVSAVSPWYAAGVGEFERVAAPMPPYGAPVFQPWTRVGAAALHWIVLAGELQRRLNLLAEADTRSRTKLPGIDIDEPAVHAPGGIPRRSNISSVLICPGFEVSSQLSVFLGLVPPVKEHKVQSTVLFLLLVLLYPLLWFFGKPTSRGADAIVWGATARIESELDTARRERGANDPRTWTGIAAGHLYRDGRVVTAPVPARCTSAQGASALWDETEARVERLVGTIQWPLHK